MIWRWIAVAAGLVTAIAIGACGGNNNAIDPPETHQPVPFAQLTPTQQQQRLETAITENVPPRVDNVIQMRSVCAPLSPVVYDCARDELADTGRWRSFYIVTFDPEDAGSMQVLGNGAETPLTRGTIGPAIDCSPNPDNCIDLAYDDGKSYSLSDDEPDLGTEGLSGDQCDDASFGANAVTGIEVTSLSCEDALEIVGQFFTSQTPSLAGGYLCTSDGASPGEIQTVTCREEGGAQVVFAYQTDGM